MSLFGLWVSLPDRAKVKVWIEAEEGDEDPGFVADADFHDRSTGVDELLRDLHLQPSERELRTPFKYTIWPSISFAKESTAYVVAEVTAVDGTPVPEVFSQKAQFRSSPISGQAGTVKGVDLSLITLEGEGGNLGVPGEEGGIQ